MNDSDRIKSLVKEADFYRSQGLLEQAKFKYSEALNVVMKNEALQKKESLINSLNKRIQAVQDTLDEIDKATDTPELAEDVQKLISNLFSFSKNKEVAAIEGAVALAKFGQYEKAFTEFQRLIDERILPLRAAENMLRCQFFFISPERAVDQYKKWVSSPIFTKKELKSLREFMVKMFKKEGIELDLPETQIALHEEPKKDTASEPVLEISSIGLRMKDNFRRDIDVELDITFQTGNILSFIVKADKKELINFLSTGGKLPEIQCYSSLSIFTAKGVVSDKKIIPSGPRKGDYAFDLTIEKV
jgi:tetratricopeptide (TPR) repeat protein